MGSRRFPGASGLSHPVGWPAGNRQTQPARDAGTLDSDQAPEGGHRIEGVPVPTPDWRWRLIVAEGEATCAGATLGRVRVPRPGRPDDQRQAGSAYASLSGSSSQSLTNARRHQAGRGKAPRRCVRVAPGANAPGCWPLRPARGSVGGPRRLSSEATRWVKLAAWDNGIWSSRTRWRMACWLPLACWS